VIRWQKYRTRKDIHVFGFGWPKETKKIEKCNADGLKYGNQYLAFQCNPSTDNGLLSVTIFFALFRLFLAINKRTLASKATRSKRQRWREDRVKALIRWQKYRTQKDIHVFGFEWPKETKKIEKGRANALNYGNQYLASNAILRLTMGSYR
jgi:hypothetical protein